MPDNEIRDQLAAYLDRFIENEAWADTGAEAAAHIRDVLGWRPPARVVETAEEFDALEPGVVVLSARGTIACRHYSGVGVLFGNGEPFPWDALALPAAILYEPEEA